jgi:hypothetical protein
MTEAEQRGIDYLFKLRKSPCHKKVNPQNVTYFQVITPHTKSSFFKNAKKGLVNAVFVFVNHAHFRDNANGVNQTCHMGCLLSVASVQHH